MWCEIAWELWWGKRSGITGWRQLWEELLGILRHTALRGFRCSRDYSVTTGGEREGSACIF